MDEEVENIILILKENERRLLDDKNRDAKRRQKDAERCRVMLKELGSWSVRLRT